MASNSEDNFQNFSSDPSLYENYIHYAHPPGFSPIQSQVHSLYSQNNFSNEQLYSLDNSGNNSLNGSNHASMSTSFYIDPNSINVQMNSGSATRANLPSNPNFINPPEINQVLLNNATAQILAASLSAASSENNGLMAANGSLLPGQILNPPQFTTGFQSQPVSEISFDNNYSETESLNFNHPGNFTAQSTNSYNSQLSNNMAMAYQNYLLQQAAINNASYGYSQASFPDVTNVQMIDINQASHPFMNAVTSQPGSQEIVQPSPSPPKQPTKTKSKPKKKKPKPKPKIQRVKNSKSESQDSIKSLPDVTRNLKHVKIKATPGYTSALAAASIDGEVTNETGSLREVSYETSPNSDITVYSNKSEISNLSELSPILTRKKSSISILSDRHLYHKHINYQELESKLNNLEFDKYLNSSIKTPLSYNAIFTFWKDKKYISLMRQKVEYHWTTFNNFPKQVGSQNRKSEAASQKTEKQHSFSRSNSASSLAKSLAAADHDSLASGPWVEYEEVNLQANRQNETKITFDEMDMMSSATSLELVSKEPINKFENFSPTSHEEDEEDDSEMSFSETSSCSSEDLKLLANPYKKSGKNSPEKRRKNRKLQKNKSQDKIETFKLLKKNKLQGGACCLEFMG